MSSDFSDKFLRFPPENEKGAGNDHQNNNASHNRNTIRLGVIGLEFFNTGRIDQIAMGGHEGMRRCSPERLGWSRRIRHTLGCGQQEE